VMVDSYLRRMTRILGAGPKQLLARAYQRGQAMVEFALIASLALVVMLVGIQFAIIGQAALAVSQASYLGARTASINANMTSGTLQTAIQNQISPTITGANVTLALTNALDPSCAGGTRTFGCGFNVTVTYNATDKLFLPSQWSILGSNALIKFPTNLTATESAMTE
jgi:Flp pilus assembly protein TadG